MGSRILDFPAASSHVPSVLLDTSVLIYYLEGIEPYSQVYKLFAQQRKTMLQSYTALIRQTEGWWIGWILEVHGIIGQERTRSELLDTLQITLREILEYETPEVSLRTESEAEAIKTADILEFGDHGASHQAESGFEEVKIDV